MICWELSHFQIEQITRKSSSWCSSLRFFRSSSFSLSFSSNSSWLSSKCSHQFSSDQVNANIPPNVQTSSTWTRYWLFSKSFERLLWSLTSLECLSIWTGRFGIFPCFFIIVIAPSYLQPLFERGPEVFVKFLLELYCSPTWFAWQPKNYLKTKYWVLIPIGFMIGILTYIWLKLMVFM